MGASLLLTHFVCLLFATSFRLGKTQTAWLIAVGAVAFVTHKGSSLILYLDIYSKQLALWQPLLVGSLIGLGICLSFLVLFRFLLWESYSHGQKGWVKLLWCLYLAGNTAEISNLLLQINAVEWGAQTLFDASTYVKDASEYGHLLKALLGFDATPTLLFVSVYIFCLVSAFLLMCTGWLAKRASAVSEQIVPLHVEAKVTL